MWIVKFHTIKMTLMRPRNVITKFCALCAHAAFMDDQHQAEWKKKRSAKKHFVDCSTLSLAESGQYIEKATPR